MLPGPTHFLHFLFVLLWKQKWPVLMLVCRQDGEENKLKLADVTLALGEVGLEAGWFLSLSLSPPLSLSLSPSLSLPLSLSPSSLSCLTWFSLSPQQTSTNKRLET